MKKKQLLVLVLAMACIATISITATLAYFTDTDTVTNTFTVGHVDIELDEKPVDTDGQNTSGDCVKENKYKLYPAKTYDKEPHFHIDKDSEDCYVFVMVENGIADIEAAGNTILAQMEANGWKLVDGETNVYYYYDATKADVEGYKGACTAGETITVFKEFTIDSAVTAERLAEFVDAEIVLTGYAIQAEGFDNANAAWAAQKGSAFSTWPTTTPEAP